MDAFVASNFVRFFRDIGLADRASVGGKGASLGELTRAGIPVPPGFVVDTLCFHTFVQMIDRDGAARRALEKLDADDLDAIAAEAGAMRDRVGATPLPASMEDAIVRAYAALGNGEETVAVRSSATGEDGEDASFAGLQDTYLWLNGPETVVKYVRSCWASLYSVESVAYRRKLRMSEDGLAMGVVVQRMVNAARSGVMFTRSPNTGDRSVIVIEASYGLGSCVVSGEVTPDKYVINKVTGEIVDRAISHKAVQHVPDLANGGVNVRPVPAELQTVPCVGDAKLAELAAIAKRVERHYGRPQDIEWAMDPAGEIFLLQSRPETVWSRRDAALVTKPTSNPLDHVFAVFGGKR